MTLEVWHDLEKKPPVGEIVIVKMGTTFLSVDYDMAIYTGTKFLLKSNLFIDLTPIVHRWAYLPSNIQYNDDDHKRGWERSRRNVQKTYSTQLYWWWFIQA